jgi:hypothetical protein
MVLGRKLKNKKVKKRTLRITASGGTSSFVLLTINFGNQIETGSMDTTSSTHGGGNAFSRKPEQKIHAPVDGNAC